MSALKLILTINRTNYINISGPSVLQKLVERNINSSGIYILISVNNKEFDFVEVAGYIKQLYSLSSDNCINCGIGKIAVVLGDVTTKYINHKLRNKEDTSEGHDYLKIHSDVVSVNEIKIHTGNHRNVSIKLIFINNNIEDYLLKNYDISVLRNYINNDNLVVHLHNEEDLKKNIASYSFKIFQKKLYQKCSPRNLSQFVERVLKYNKRGFKLYMKVKYNKTIHITCECKKINCTCLTTLHIDILFLTTLHAGIVAHKYDNSEYYYNQSRFSRCYNSGLNVFYKIDLNRYELPSGFYDIKPLAIETIINKFILLKEFNEYSFRPDILSKRLGDVFEE